MGFEITKTDIEASVKKNDLSLLVPLFNQTGSDLSRALTVNLTKEPGSSTCYSRAEIRLEARYTTIASDSSDLKDVLKFLEKIVSLYNAVPSPGTIVNAVKDGVTTLEAIIENENVKGTPVKMDFPITACPASAAVAIIATLSFQASGMISNAEEDEEYDPDEPGQAFAKAYTVCNIGTDTRETERTVSGRDAEQGNTRQYTITNWALLRGSQTVVAEVRPHCRVTDDFTVWDEIAGLTINWVQLTIEAVPPTLYRAKFDGRFLKYLKKQAITIPAAGTAKERKVEEKIRKAEDAGRTLQPLPAGSRKSATPVDKPVRETTRIAPEKPTGLTDREDPGHGELAG